MNRLLLTLIVIMTWLLLVADCDGQQRLTTASPWIQHTIDNQSQGADGARLADVNGDGRLDLVTPWEEGGIIRICLHPGTAKVKSAWPSVTVGRVASPEDAVLVDLDGDGQLDVVSSCEGKVKTMFVHWAPRDPADHLNSEKWETEPIPVTQGLQAWMFAMPLDIDGQHGLDLIVSSKGSNGSVGWLQAPSEPRNLSDWKYHRLLNTGWVMSLIAFDFNEDGLQDILVSDRKGAERGIKWLQHPGHGQAVRGDTWQEHFLGGKDHEVMFIDFADVNGDGLRDIAAATHQREILLLHQTANTERWEASTIPAPHALVNGKSVRIGDIDLDGEADIVHSTEPNSGPRKPGVTWIQGAVSAEKTNKVSSISDLKGSKFDLLQLVDVDDDGDLDVITCEERDNLGLIWYENPLR